MPDLLLYVVLGSVTVITDLSLFRYPDRLDAKRILSVKWAATLTGIAAWLVLASLADYDLDEQLKLSIPLMILFFFIAEIIYCYPKLTQCRQNDM